MRESSGGLGAAGSAALEEADEVSEPENEPEPEGPVDP